MSAKKFDADFITHSKLMIIC